MAKRTTLADIAKVAGVTTMTVQRALKGSGGVGDELRRRILQIAEEMDYKPNVMASALKKGKLKVAAVLPDAESENQYYASCLWDGLEGYVENNSIFQIQCCKIPYERSPVNQALAMEKMLEQCGDDIDGVISMGGDDPGFLHALKHLDDKKIPYVFIGTDYQACNRLCCVTAYNEIAGSLAADLFLNFVRRSDTGRILLTGDFSIQDQNQNASGFEKQIKQRNGNFEIVKLSNFGTIDSVSRSLAQFLRADMDVAGIYSCSARNTLAMCRAIDEAGKCVTAIGSDVFAENVQLMKEGKLSAIIHKRHYDQAYRAAQILVEYLAEKKRPVNPNEMIMPVIVMNGNIDCFIENRQWESRYTF